MGTVLDVLLRERTAELVLRSLALTAAVTVLCLVLGVSLAGLVARTGLPGRRSSHRRSRAAGPLPEDLVPRLGPGAPRLEQEPRRRAQG